MSFFTNRPKRRYYANVLLLSLLWFHIFITYSPTVNLSTGVLCSGENTVIQSLERTGSNLVLPSTPNNERLRHRLPLILVFAAAAIRLLCGRLGPEPHANEMRNSFNIWDILVGKEFSSLPHSDMVFRL